MSSFDKLLLDIVRRTEVLFIGIFMFGLFGIFHTIFPLQGWAGTVIQIAMWLAILFCSAVGFIRLMN